MHEKLQSIKMQHRENRLESSYHSNYFERTRIFSPEIEARRAETVGRST